MISRLRVLVPSSISSYVPKIGHGFVSSRYVSSLPEPCESSDESGLEDEIEWNNLGFHLMKTDYMYMMKCEKDDEFKQGQLNRYGNIELSPSAAVLNYGQNAIRMQFGAERMCMPSPSISQFVDAVKQTALANRRWIPPPGKGSLYIRPLLIGTGPVLGLAPAPDYTFLVYASPVGNYFKGGSAPLNLYVEDEFHRAMHGGAGGVKSITNYAPVLKAINKAKDRGFSDVLYLDSATKRNIEEVSSCNVFIVKNNVLSTPESNGNILQGVTRKSIIEIASDMGYKVEERCIPIEELIDADEVFCTGTAVGVAPVGSISYKGKRTEYKMSNQLACLKLYSRLVGIQNGIIEDKREWVIQID
ncbi:hypothetical protein RD792_017610 [Penstemon davidsonii]|uniref:Branched-chain-amino-acid aminotransferase n=1 Tax=Penstemon davidsonii TaxID=160366 RepID=A0ABR0CMI0_9LAMI|nr:hypothetical protein RD792_017610 [Penstemon davidsonii]